jgi:hypothetical protein
MPAQCEILTGGKASGLDHAAARRGKGIKAPAGGMRRGSFGVILVAAILAMGMWLTPAEAFAPWSAVPRQGASSFSAAQEAAALSRAPRGMFGNFIFGSSSRTQAATVRAAPSSGIRGASMGNLKNGDKIGIQIPQSFSEGADFVRDGKNLKIGDIVLVTRSDGRWPAFPLPPLNGSPACCQALANLLCFWGQKAMLPKPASHHLSSLHCILVMNACMPSLFFSPNFPSLARCAASRLVRLSSRSGSHGKMCGRYAWRQTERAMRLRPALRRASTSESRRLRVWASLASLHPVWLPVPSPCRDHRRRSLLPLLPSVLPFLRWERKRHLPPCLLELRGPHRFVTNL